MQDQIINILGLSDYLTLSKIPKKEFYEEDDFSKQHEKIFTNHIDSITLLSSLNKDTINISPELTESHDYREIYYIHISLKSMSKIQDICSIIHSIIPTSCVLIFGHETKCMFSSAQKRVNKNDRNKQVIEHIHLSPTIDLEHISKQEQKFLDDIYITKNNFDTFKRFYLDISGKIFIFLLSDIRGGYRPTELFKLSELSTHYQKIKTLELEQANKKQEYNNHISPGDQAKIHIEIHKLQQRVEKLKQTIKNI